MEWRYAEAQPRGLRQKEETRKGQAIGAGKEDSSSVSETRK